MHRHKRRVERWLPSRGSSRSTVDRKTRPTVSKPWTGWLPSDTPTSFAECIVETRQLTDEEGGGYLATLPEFPGCMGDGPTAEEAVKDLYQAYLAMKSAKNLAVVGTEDQVG